MINLKTKKQTVASEGIIILAFLLTCAASFFLRGGLEQEGIIARETFTSSLFISFWVVLFMSMISMSFMVPIIIFLFAAISHQDASLYLISIISFILTIEIWGSRGASTKFMLLSILIELAVVLGVFSIFFFI